MFSSVIIMYGLVNPSILICLVPVRASEKLTSIEGLVSKLSARLQQAALSNSLLVTTVVLAVMESDFFIPFLLPSTFTSSSFSSFSTCEKSAVENNIIRNNGMFFMVLIIYVFKMHLL